MRSKTMPIKIKPLFSFPKYFNNQLHAVISPPNHLFSSFCEGKNRIVESSTSCEIEIYGYATILVYISGVHSSPLYAKTIKEL